MGTKLFEFSISFYTGNLAKAKEPNLSNSLPMERCAHGVMVIVIGN